MALKMQNDISDVIEVLESTMTEPMSESVRGAIHGSVNVLKELKALSSPELAEMERDAERLAKIRETIAEFQDAIWRLSSRRAGQPASDIYGDPPQDCDDWKAWLVGRECADEELAADVLLKIALLAMKSATAGEDGERG